MNSTSSAGLPLPGANTSSSAPSAGAGRRLLAAFSEIDRDPLLDRYAEIMRRRGYQVEMLAVEAADPHRARSVIRDHPGVRDGSVEGIQLFGKSIPSFRLRYLYPSGTMDSRGASDLPFGADLDAFDQPYPPAPAGRQPAWLVSAILDSLLRAPTVYRQAQWVSRIFRLDERYLGQLDRFVAPAVNRMLIVDADPNTGSPEQQQQVRDNYRRQYTLFATGQEVRFANSGVEFGKGELTEYLTANLDGVTFLSIADHGTASNLDSLPPNENGVPQLPNLAPTVEFAACGVGDWMSESDREICVAEAALRKGCLTTIAPQSLLSWNLTRGIVDPNPGTDPRDEGNQNPAPMLEVWPANGTLGRAQADAVSQALALLKTSAYNEKSYIIFQVLCAHSLFGDGTMEFVTSSIA